jgi:transcriptional regulator with XRE-family HTH domain
MKLHANIVYDTAELGQLIRSERKASGVTLQQTSARCKIGVRFLSELERGKATAEIGKVISALHTVGLDMAVVQKPVQYQIENTETETVEDAVPTYGYELRKSISDQLNLEFPYDWSNPEIDDAAFIRMVLAKTRFNDILSIAHHYGIEQLEAEVQHFIDTPQHDIILKLLSHIRAGIKLATENNSSHTTSKDPSRQ